MSVSMSRRFVVVLSALVCVFFSPSSAQLNCDSNLQPTSNWISVQARGIKTFFTAGQIRPIGPHYCAQMFDDSETYSAQYQLVRPPVKQSPISGLDKCTLDSPTFLQCSSMCRNSTIQNKVLQAVLDNSNDANRMAQVVWGVYNSDFNIVVDVVVMDEDASIWSVHQPSIGDADLFCSVRVVFPSPRKEYYVIAARVIYV